MNLLRALTKEHSRAQTIKIADYVGLNKARFKELVEVYLAGPYRITQRAAGPLSLCVARHPFLLKSHFKPILDYLETPGIHDAVKRNTVRLLQFVDIPKAFQGRVADLCFKSLTNLKEPVAIRVFSMTVLSQLAIHEPDLLQELEILIEDQINESSPAFRSRGQKVLKDIRKRKIQRGQ